MVQGSTGHAAAFAARGRRAIQARSTLINRPYIARDRAPGGPGGRSTVRVNNMIRISPIRLIDDANNQVGVVDLATAQRMAQEAGLDLVEISPDARPPVCKIMDYGKFKYELSKKEQKSRAASKQAEMKEVRLGRSLKIDDHDVQIRVDQARRFLIDGHKVQLVQQFRGREMAYQGMGIERMREICDSLGDVSKVEVPPRTMGKRMSLILAPDKAKIDAYKKKHGIVDKPRKAEDEDDDAPQRLGEGLGLPPMDDDDGGDDQD